MYLIHFILVKVYLNYIFQNLGYLCNLPNVNPHEKGQPTRQNTHFCNSTALLRIYLVCHTTRTSQITQTITFQCHTIIPTFPVLHWTIPTFPCKHIVDKCCNCRSIEVFSGSYHLFNRDDRMHCTNCCQIRWIPSYVKVHYMNSFLVGNLSCVNVPSHRSYRTTIIVDIVRGMLLDRVVNAIERVYWPK